MTMINLLQYWQENQTILLLASGIFSLLVGSFLNVVIARLPRIIMQTYKTNCQEFLGLNTQELPLLTKKFNLLIPRSHCPKCQQQIAFWENIPILSFILLRGKCHHCQQPISLRYPIVEILTTILSMLVVWKFALTLKTIAILFLVWLLIIQAFIDLEHTIIPDELTIPAIWLGLLNNCYLTFCPPIDAIIGAICGYLILWIIYWTFKLCTGKEGMGYGDFKLLAMLGAWLGWQLLPLIIIISSILGSIVGISLIFSKNKNFNSAIPFGPYLAIAGFIALLYGKQINALYLSFMLL